METTTIPVKPETLARLRSYKVGGATYDDVLNDLMDDQPPEGFIREHLRRLKQEPFSDWKDVRKRFRGALGSLSLEGMSDDDIAAMVREWRLKKGRR